VNTTRREFRVYTRSETTLHGARPRAHIAACQKRPAAGQTEGCAGPHREGGGRGRGRTRGEENYKRFCGVPFQGRRPKGNVIVVVWYTSRREHGYIYIQQINKPTSVPGAVLPVPPEATPPTRLLLACHTAGRRYGRWRHARPFLVSGFLQVWLVSRASPT